MKLMQLGRSAAIPPKGEYNTSYLVDTKGFLVLLDCAPSILNQLANAGMDFGLISWVYVSHRHGDHILGLPMLFAAGYIAGADKIWNVVVQDNLVDRIRELVDIAYPELADYMNTNVKFHCVPDTGDFDLSLRDDIWLSTVYGLHGVPSLAVRIDDGVSSIVYSGDTCANDNLVHLAEDVDLLIHEAGDKMADQSGHCGKNHTTAWQAGEAARKCCAGRLVLTHLNSLDDDFIDRCVSVAKDVYGGSVEVLTDFKWIKV